MNKSASEQFITSQPEQRKRRKGNWRLTILASPKTRTPKFEEPVYHFDSGVRPEALKAALKDRDVHISIPPLRKLYENKRTFAGNPNTLKNYAENMDKRIDMAWNSIYNEYRKVRRDRRLERLKRIRERKYQKLKSKKSGDKSKGKKGKDEDGGSYGSEDHEKQFLEWAKVKALPKKVFDPEPINRGPPGDLDAMKPKIDVMATPLKPREKYVDLPPPKHLVKESALTYEPTDRIVELSQPLARYATKEPVIILGSVKPGALLYKATERDVLLATPRPRATAEEADLKENPFMISPGALKCKPSPRIIELAKPRIRK